VKNDSLSINLKRSIGCGIKSYRIVFRMVLWVIRLCAHSMQELYLSNSRH